MFPNNSYTAPIITPENLVDITIQYRLPSGGSPSNAPTVFLRYGLINVQQKRISIAEIKPYISYLQIRATIEGKTVIAVQTSNFKTVIQVGNASTGIGFAVPVQVAVNPNDPCGEIPLVVFISHAAPFVPGDILYADGALTTPLAGFDTVVRIDTGNVYALNNVTGVVGALTGATCTTPPPANNKLINIEVDGVPITIDNVLTNMLNGQVNSVSQYQSKSIGAWFEVEIPARGNGNNLQFSQDYAVSGIGGQQYVRAFWSAAGTTIPGAVWIVEFFDFNTANAVINIDFQRADLVEVINVLNGAGQSLEFNFYKNAFTTLYPVSFVGGTQEQVFITRDTEIYPAAFAQSSIAGVWNVTKYNAAGVPLSTQYNVCSAEGTVTIPPTCTKLEFKYKQLNFVNDIVGSASKIIITDWSLSGYAFANIYDESGTEQYLRYPKGLGGGVPGTIGIAVIDAALLPFNVKFYRLGVLTDTIAVVTQLQQLNPTAPGEWDTLVFGTGAAPSFTIGIENQMGAVPTETTNISAIQVNALPVGGITFPVFPLQSKAGTQAGGAAVTVDVTLSGTTAITPTTVRVIDAAFVNHDQAFTADGVYSFPAINCDGFIQVILF